MHRQEADELLRVRPDEGGGLAIQDVP